MDVCVNCRKLMRNEWYFCPYCGKKLNRGILSLLR